MSDPRDEVEDVVPRGADPEEVARRVAAHLGEIRATQDWDEIMAGRSALDYESLDENQFAAAKAMYSWIHNHEYQQHGIAPWSVGQRTAGFADRIRTAGTPAHAGYHGIEGGGTFEPTAPEPFETVERRRELPALTEEQKARIDGRVAERRRERRSR